MVSVHSEKGKTMNTVQLKNNIYKNGEYERHISNRMAKEKAKAIEPTLAELKLRDALRKFCTEKGLIRDGFRIGRTKQGIRSNIHAFFTILEKNGLKDEFFKEYCNEG
jgi:hypothetical protein